MNSNFKIDVRYGQKDASGSVTWKSEKDHNLINNGGLDMLATYWATKCTENVYLETGGRENARLSGTILLEQFSDIVTSDEPFFFDDDALNNRLIVFADGTTAGVKTYISSTSVEVFDSKSVLAQTASIYYVEENLMDEFAKASTTYLTGAGFNENTWSVADEVLTLVNKRTVEFPIEPTDITYKGVGWTPLIGNSQPVFGRKVMDIEISASTQPIIEVTMTREIDVSAITVNDTLITGISESAETMNLMGSTNYNTIGYWSSIDANGLTVAPTQLSTFMECVTTESCDVALSEYNGALDLINIDISGSLTASQTIAQTYVAGNFYSDYIATFTPADFTSVDWNTISLVNKLDPTEAWWRLKFDTPQDFTLKLLSGLRIRKSWNRKY